VYSNIFVAFLEKGASTKIGANGITLQKDCESFLVLFHMKEFLNEIFCSLLLKIHIVAPMDHMFCVNHC
jgi:hypothetical protein